MNNINSNDKNKTPQSAPAAGKDSTDQKDTRTAAPADNAQQTGGKDAAQGNQPSSK